jgi:hypothetical protein
LLWITACFGCLRVLYCLVSCSWLLCSVPDSLFRC